MRMTVVPFPSASAAPSKASLATIAAWLRGVAPFAGLVAFDEVSGRLVLRREPPTIALEPGADLAEPRPLRDGDIAVLAERLELAGLISVKIETVAAAAGIVGRENAFDPLADALRALRWDGRARLDKWTSHYLGAAPSLHHHAVGRAWMIGAVARVLRPGCKNDSALILEGAQGSGKSTAARLLAGSEKYFSDALPSLESKDGQGHLVGKWIIELSELDNLRKSEVETIKRFLSATHVKYRPPYARYEVEVPRRCVFIGTTNRNQYLQDVTGNQRFWPIATGDIDLAGLARDRDQLLAEAAVAFERGELWHLVGAEVVNAAAAADERIEGDLWAERLSEEFNERVAVSFDEVRQALGIDLSRFGTSEQRRVRACLALAGWTAGPKDPATRRRLFVRAESVRPTRASSTRTPKA